MIVQIVRPVLTIELACKIRDSMRKLGHEQFAVNRVDWLPGRRVQVWVNVPDTLVVQYYEGLTAPKDHQSFAARTISTEVF